MANVMLKFTGNVHSRMGVFRMRFSFEGTRLRDLLRAFTGQHNVRDLLLAENGNLKPYARVLVNGHFSEVLMGLDTPVQDGDTIVLIHPYAVAF